MLDNAAVNSHRRVLQTGMKTLFITIFSLGLFGLLGYSLYLPASVMYFHGQTLFISSVAATAECQMWHTLVFAISGTLGTVILQRVFAMSSLLKALVCTLGLAASNLLVLMALLQVKSTFFEPLNTNRLSHVPLSDFSVYGYVVAAAIIALVITGAANLFPRRQPVWY